MLGSGGNTPTPMPTCGCRVCVEAREQGIPYARHGNAVFLHDADTLIDAPEFVWQALNREAITNVDYLLLSHFHADHTLGLRVLQPLGVENPPLTDFLGELPTLLMSEVTHERVIEGNEVFSHLTETWADVEVLEAGASRSLGDVEVTHHTAPIEAGGPAAVSGFCFDSDDATAFVSPDENRHFDLEALPPLDLWIKETGYFPETPDGRPLVTDAAVEGPLAHELTFAESLAQVRAVQPDRTVFTEIEELYRRSYDDYHALAQQHADLNIAFGYDGMEIRL